MYQERLAALRNAIDIHLWSDGLGAYILSEAVPNGFSQDSNPIVMLAGVNLAANHSSQTILSTLSADLMRPSGPLAFSSDVIASGFQPYISPLASAYHLRAAPMSNNSDAALEMLNSVWAPMADTRNTNFTGCFWETLDEAGLPGLGITTSLCHGWSAGPTPELTKYVLGATPTKPDWAKARVAPLTLGLRSAKGRIPVVGGVVEVDWALDGNDLLNMPVNSPVGTTGTVNLPSPMVAPADQSVITFNGIVIKDMVLKVVSGISFALVQSVAS